MEVLSFLWVMKQKKFKHSLAVALRALYPLHTLHLYSALWPLPGPLYSTCMPLQMLHTCDLNYGTLATERIPHTCGYNFCTIASGAADMEFVMDAWTLSV